MKEKRLRKELEKLERDKQYEFEATFKKTSASKFDKSKQTILLLDIYLINEEGQKELLCDHIWVQKSKRWQRFDSDLKEGQKIRFRAEVGTYFKDMGDHFEENLALQRIRSISLV